MNEMVKKSAPELVEMLNTLNQELIQMDDNSRIIMEKIDMIKTGEIRVDDKQGVDVDGGMIGGLWSCINRMRKYNQRLCESKEALTQLVG